MSCQKLRQYKVAVEGEQNGVPFRIKMKRLDWAENLAMEVCGVIEDLRTGVRRKWTGKDWKEVV